MRILVTGGAGYIGSHTLIELLARGRLFVVDNYANSCPDVLRAVQEISGSALWNENIDITDEVRLAEFLMLVILKQSCILLA